MSIHIRTDRHGHPIGPDFLPDADVVKARARAALAWVKDLWVCLDRTRVFGLAAETSFWLFLSLLPLAAVAGLVAARFSVEHWSEVTPLLSSLPEAARLLIAQQLVEVSAWNQGTVGVTAGLVFVWLASSGIHSIFDSLELETDASRPWWKKRLLAIATCIALSVAVAILTVLGPGLEGALGWLGRWIPLLAGVGEPTPVGRVFRFLTSTLIVFAYVSGLYWVGVPAPARRRMPIVPGAVVAVVLEILLGLVYAVYLRKVGTGNAYTAGLAVMGITLMGLYLFTLALLTGAVVNRKLGHDRACRRSI